MVIEMRWNTVVVWFETNAKTGNSSSCSWRRCRQSQTRPTMRGVAAAVAVQWHVLPSGECVHIIRYRPCPAIWVTKDAFNFRFTDASVSHTVGWTTASLQRSVGWNSWQIICQLSFTLMDPLQCGTICIQSAVSDSSLSVLNTFGRRLKTYLFGE